MNLELIHDLWVPNIFIYNLKTFQVIDVLSKLAGLWINNKKEVYYRFVDKSVLYNTWKPAAQNLHCTDQDSGFCYIAVLLLLFALHP